MSTLDFRKLVTKHLAPRIRELGWKGSGKQYRKFDDNHIVNIFGMNGSWMGGSICCETAIHLDFVNDLAGCAPKKATHGSCIIRQRLPPKDGTWCIGKSEEANKKTIDEI